MQRKNLLLLLALLMVINIVLSVVIMVQKSGNDTLEGGNCFADGGGCFTVQTSPYASVFGIPNPVLGIVFFGILTINLIFLAFNLLGNLRRFFLILSSTIFFGGALFSVWLLHVQYMILRTICTYCIWVDAIMIFSTVLFIFIFWKELKS